MSARAVGFSSVSACGARSRPVPTAPFNCSQISPAGGSFPGSRLTMAPDPRVQHLLRRAGFGASAAEAASFSERGFNATLNELVDYQRTPDAVDSHIGQPGYAAVTPSAGAAEPFSPAASINDARQRWLFRMVHTRRPLQEKMALFWHQHFATAYSKIAGTFGAIQGAKMMANVEGRLPGPQGQLETFREKELGSFRDLMVEMARDPAM